MASHQAYLTGSLLAQPAVQATRIVAAARLDACVDALKGLDTDSADALHDLRVSLRRLRSWLRAFRPYVDDTVRRRRLRKLRRLVRATNGARDREVWIAWISEQSDLPVRARQGARYVADCLTTESASLNDDAVSRVQRRLPKTIDALRREFETYSLHVGDDRGRRDPTMAIATAQVVCDGYARLRQRIEAIESEHDIPGIHQTRIAAKKLRYVVETLDPRPAAAEVTRALIELQDALGAARDLQLLVDRLLDEIASAGGADARRKAEAALDILQSEDEHAAPRGAIVGLTELARRARRRAHEQFETFAAAWYGPQLDTVGSLVSGIADELETLPSVLFDASDQRIERIVAVSDDSAESARSEAVPKS